MTPSKDFMYNTGLLSTDGKLQLSQINLSFFGPHDSFNYCYKPIALVTLKMSGIVKSLSKNPKNHDF